MAQYRKWLRGAALFFIPAILFHIAAQQQKPMYRGTDLPDAPSPVNDGRRVVAAIGITEYANWLRLPSANPEARAVRDTLIKDFGFIEPVPALLDKRATKEAIEGFTGRLRGKLKPDDELVLLFAGHDPRRGEASVRKWR